MNEPDKQRRNNVKPRWKKGESGNPKGRPPKAISLTSQLKKQIEAICENDKQRRTYLELVVLATIQLAIKGNAAALKEIWDRIDGKVRQDVGVDVNVNSEIDRRIAEGRLRASRRNDYLAPTRDDPNRTEKPAPIFLQNAMDTATPIQSPVPQCDPPLKNK